MDTSSSLRPSVFYSGPSSVERFVASSPYVALTSAFGPTRPSACRECNALPSPSPVWFEHGEGWEGSSTRTSLEGQGRTSASLGGGWSARGWGGESLFPVSAGLGMTETNAVFRRQLTALRASLASYRSALDVAFP